MISLKDLILIDTELFSTIFLKLSKLENFIHNCFLTNLDFLEPTQATLKTLALTTHDPITKSKPFHFHRVESFFQTCRSQSQVDLAMFPTCFPKAAAISISCFEENLVFQIEELFKACNHLNRFVMHAYGEISKHQLRKLATRNATGEASVGLIVTKHNGLKWHKFGKDNEQYSQITWEHYMMDYFIQKNSI